MIYVAMKELIENMEVKNISPLYRDEIFSFNHIEPEFPDQA